MSKMKMRDRWRMLDACAGSANEVKLQSGTSMRASNGKPTGKVYSEKIGKFSRVEIPASHRKELQSVNHFNSVAGLMDCKDVDKFFAYEGGVPAPAPRKSKRKAPLLELDAVQLHLIFGAVIVDDGLHRKVVKNGKIIGHITNGLLTQLKKAPDMISAPIKNTNSVVWMKRGV